MSHELIQMAHRQICTHKISRVSEKYLLKTDTFLSNGKQRRSQEKCCVRNEYVSFCPECLAFQKVVWKGNQHNYKEPDLLLFMRFGSLPQICQIQNVLTIGLYCVCGSAVMPRKAATSWRLYDTSAQGSLPASNLGQKSNLELLLASRRLPVFS